MSGRAPGRGRRARRRVGARRCAQVQPGGDVPRSRPPMRVWRDHVGMVTRLPDGYGRHLWTSSNVPGASHGPARSRSSRSTRPGLLLFAAHATPVPTSTSAASPTQLDALVALRARRSGCRHPFSSPRVSRQRPPLRRPAQTRSSTTSHRHLGIPITLSVVMIEAARRLGVPSGGDRMPAHFIRAGDADVYCDPFGGGRLLNADGLPSAVLQPDWRGSVAFEPSSLDPGRMHRRCLSRMLADLEHRPYAADPLRLAEFVSISISWSPVWSGERVRPGVAVGEHRALRGRGRYHGGTGAPALRQQAPAAFRSRLN